MNAEQTARHSCYQNTDVSIYPLSHHTLRETCALSFDHTDVLMRINLGECFPDMLLLCLKLGEAMGNTKNIRLTYCANLH